MSYKIVPARHFNGEVKRLVKKYPSLKKELIALLISLKVDPKQGNPLGDDVFKIRLAIKSKNKGKVGGARVITFVHAANTTVFLIAIYSKGEKDDISDQELQKLIQNLEKSKDQNSK